MLDYSDYIKGISFRFLKQGVYCQGFNRLFRWLNKFNLSVEFLNTVLPENNKIMQSRLGGLLKIPRMSTFAIGAMINTGVRRMNADCSYVNVGVWHGFTLLAGMVDNPQKKCIGIDNHPREQFIERFDHYKNPNHHFYGMDYRDYFSQRHSGKIGFYLYDGDHRYENQLEGLRIAEPYFTRKCIILVDDTNAYAPRQATLDFIAESSNKYTILLDASTCNNRHPTFWNGIMVLQRTG